MPDRAPARAAEDQAGQTSFLPALEEVLHACTTFFDQTSEDNRPRVLGTLLPPITWLLQGDERPGSVHKAAVMEFLLFTSTTPATFKEAAGLMKQAQKDLLEASIRQAVADQSKLNVQATQIAFQSF